MRAAPALLALALLLAGCTGSPNADQPGPAGGGTAPPAHALAGAVEPGAFEAPAFRLLGALAKTGPVYGGGEPSVWAGLDGSLYVAFPGCDRGVFLVEVPAQETCEHGVIYRSLDDGATWTRLNRAGDGRYEDGGEAPAANGDAEVAVDAAGTVYASNLGDGIQMHKSADQGATWTYMGDVVEEGQFADRQWIAASHPGHLVVAWMGSGDDADGNPHSRAVVVNSTLDGGASWTGSVALGDNIGWLGPVAFDPDGMTAYVPFTQVEQPSALSFLPVAGSQTFSMRVAKTADGGATWEVLDTGARWASSATGGHWSGVHMAPALDVTGDGTVVVAYSIDVVPPVPAASTGAAIRILRSRDGGATWQEGADLRGSVALPTGDSSAGSAIMPWVVGGAGDRFAVTYLYTASPADNDYAGATWDVRAAVFDAEAGEVLRHDVLVEANVHQGGVCTRGGTCLLTGSDRALLDFFEADLTPDGRLFLAYPADPVSGGKYIDIRVAIQDGGTPLLARPGPEPDHSRH